VCDNFTLSAGASVDASSKGYERENGPGRGGSDYGFGSGGGGGYGGAGGHGFSAHPGATGGPTYGSSNAPAGLGSGGGQGQAGWFAGYGGGAIRLEVAQKATLDGTLSADGQDSPTWNCGGGSGGAIFIECWKLSGVGTLGADGGAGGPDVAGYGGGGGGGRIAVWRVPRRDEFSGTAHSTGGTKGNNSSPGADGTVVWGDVFEPVGTLCIVR
jgi:hypothetical protein